MTASPSRTRGRPRSTTTDTKIAAATLTLLAEAGPAAVTMEAVAARAGVAKTTLYRRHPDRAALLRHTLERAVGEPAVPDGDDVRSKTRAALAEVWAQMSDVLGPGGLAALVADSDAELSGLIRDVLRPYDEALAAQLAADRDAGLLRADLDPDAAVTLFLGAYLGAVVRHGRVSPDWLDRSVDLLWHSLVDVSGAAGDAG